jgi:hypothetical protein
MKDLGKFCLLTLVVLLVASMPVAAQTSSCVNPTTGMVAWWTGDNTTADYLKTSNGLVSSPVTFAPGEVGAAFSFDGTQSMYVQIPRTDLLESMTVAVSVEAWVRSTAPGNFKYIFSKGANSDGASYAFYTGANGGLIFYVSDGQNFFLSPDASEAVWDGNWHHVTGTYDGSLVHLYVDGIEVGGGSSAPNVTIGYGLALTNDAFIGTFNGISNFGFVGQVDEVVISNRALGVSEIQGVFNAGTGGMCKVVTPINTGAVGMGYWKNKNGQGLIAAGASTSAVCNSGTWLRQYSPFQDLSYSATCKQVASYVLNVISGASAKGPSMNAMLKAQMLTTALDVYFSDPNLGGNKLGGPNPIGGVAIKLSTASASFGGATSLTVSEMLAYASGQSLPGGGIWYGNVKAVQERAKNAFESVNSMTAFAP